jgi:hypothetical protein
MRRSEGASFFSVACQENIDDERDKVVDVRLGFE